MMTKLLVASTILAGVILNVSIASSESKWSQGELALSSIKSNQSDMANEQATCNYISYHPMKSDERSDVSSAVLSSVKFDLKPFRSKITNTGETVLIETASEAGVLEFDGETYELMAYDFIVNPQATSAQTEAELRLLHRNPTGRVMIVSVGIELGSHNPTISDSYSVVSDEHGDVTKGPQIDPMKLLPNEPEGQLFKSVDQQSTCFRDVRWLVLDQTISAGESQIDLMRQFASDHQDNAICMPCGTTRQKRVKTS